MKDKEQQRLECLNRAIGTRDCLRVLIKDLQKEYEEACESVEIWSKKQPK